MRSHRYCLPLLGMLLIHCGPAVEGSAPGTEPPSVATQVNSLPDAGLPETDGGSLVSPTSPAPVPTAAAGPLEAGIGTTGDACSPTAADPADDMGLDTNCDGADGVVGVDVYVDPKSGQDTNDGSPKTPFQSLAKALATATGRGGSILVAAGELDGDTLPLSGAWHLFGGYGGTFVGAPDRQATVFQASASGLLVDGATTDGELAHVTVRAARSSDSSQPSVHALKSRASKLALHDLSLQASDAAGGMPGPLGSQGTDGSSSATCNGVPEPAYALGQVYGRGAAPDGTAPGSIDSAGGHPAMAAGSGNAGSDGQDSPSGLHLLNDDVVGGQATTGQSNGTPGFGGAGGAQATSWSRGASSSPISYTIWGGTGGNGGCAGLGGGPGQSGGTSVALLVLAGEVDVSDSSLQAGFGGQGGDGGQGGAGGTGGLGTAPYLYPTWPVPLSASCSAALPSGDLMGLNCAAYGGPGGSGGAGGHGGAGAGGWSIGILAAQGAKYVVDGSTTISVRKAGPGGQGSAGGTAPSGRAVSTFSLTQ